MSDFDIQQAKQKRDKALQALAELSLQQQQKPLQIESPYPPSSSLNNENVQSALQTLSQPEQFKSLFVCRNVLNGGELSSHIKARYDLPRYQTGCDKLLNMIPLPQGGITKRPGLEYLGDSTKGSKFIPFVSSVTDCLMLEAISGGQIRGWTTTDGKMSSLGISLPRAVAPNDVTSFAQSADVIFCATPKWNPFKIMRTPTGWKLVEMSFGSSRRPLDEYPGDLFSKWIEYNFQDPDNQPPDEKIHTYYAITGIDEKTGMETQPFYFDAYKRDDAKAASHTPSPQAWVEMYFNPIKTGLIEYRIYKRKNGVYGFIGTSKGNETFCDRGIVPDTTDPLPDTKLLSLAWDSPSIVFLYQQRLGFAAGPNNPLTIWMSQSGFFECFDTHTPPKDDDAIEVTLASTQANRILWAIPDRNALAIGTEGGEWTLTGSSEGAAVTPSNVAFQSQSYHGSQAGIDALRAGTSLVYIQRGGHAAREFSYSFQSDKYQSDDLSLLARHLLRDSQVVSWAWQGEPHGIIWMVLKDGTCAALTFMKEHEVIAWHRHTTPNGKFLDVACIPGPDGNDQVWFHVERNGKVSVERLKGFVEKADPASYFHTDGKEKKEFQARCVPTMPEMNLQTGSTVMRVRKINSVKCRVMNSMPFQVQIGEEEPLSVPIRGADFTELGDWNCPIAGRWREGDNLEFIFDGKDPVTLLAVTSTVELADMGGSQQ